MKTYSGKSNPAYGAIHMNLNAIVAKNNGRSPNIKDIKIPSAY